MCKILVELMVFVMEQNTVLSLMPICNLKITSSNIPKINNNEPVIIEIFKYLLVSISLSIACDNIKNNVKHNYNDVFKSLSSIEIESKTFSNEEEFEEYLDNSKSRQR